MPAVFSVIKNIVLDNDSRKMKHLNANKKIEKKEKYLVKCLPQNLFHAYQRIYVYLQSFRNINRESIPRSVIKTDN